MSISSILGNKLSSCRLGARNMKFLNTLHIKYRAKEFQYTSERKHGLRNKRKVFKWHVRRIKERALKGKLNYKTFLWLLLLLKPSNLSIKKNGQQRLFSL